MPRLRVSSSSSLVLAFGALLAACSTQPAEQDRRPLVDRTESGFCEGLLENACTPPDLPVAEETDAEAVSTRDPSARVPGYDATVEAEGLAMTNDDGSYLDDAVATHDGDGYVGWGGVGGGYGEASGGGDAYADASGGGAQDGYEDWGSAREVDVSGLSDAELRFLEELDQELESEAYVDYDWSKLTYDDALMICSPKCKKDGVTSGLAYDKETATCVHFARTMQLCFDHLRKKSGLYFKAWQLGVGIEPCISASGTKGKNIPHMMSLIPRNAQGKDQLCCVEPQYAFAQCDESPRTTHLGKATKCFDFDLKDPNNFEGGKPKISVVEKGCLKEVVEDWSCTITDGSKTYFDPIYDTDDAAEYTKLKEPTQKKLKEMGIPPWAD